MQIHQFTNEAKWSKKYKSSIDCNNPKGFSQKAHCAGKKKTESILEGYKLQLERGSDMDVLHITDTKTGRRTEVRGKSGYESGNYDADDKLHQLLDRIGKAANISELINGEPVGINPNHPDGKSAKADTDRAFNERELSKKEVRKRDKLVDKLPANEFKKRYGKDWEAVMYGTATNMAKKK